MNVPVPTAYITSRGELIILWNMDLRVIDRIEYDEVLHSELWLNETESYTLSGAR